MVWRTATSREWADGPVAAVQAYIEGLLQAAMAERERHIFWVPVALGLGIAIYFLLPFEPPPGATVLGVTSALAVHILASQPRKWLTLGLLLIFAGLGLGQLRTAVVAAPVLDKRMGPVDIVATVEAVEDLGGGHHRLLLSSPRPQADNDSAVIDWPVRIRVTVRTDMPGLNPGDRVRLDAILLPPPEPVAPGAFDFARQAFFERLGAVGFAVSDVGWAEQPRRFGPGRWVQSLRERIAGRIRNVLTGESGAVAVALLTGLRSGLPEEVETVMREAGLAHLLAISGLHVGLVTAAVFFVIRAALAGIPALALRMDPKQAAALIAWVVAGLYVMLAGATIPTLRAFLMTSLVLLAVIMGRQAISMRLVAFAGTAILVFAPESLLSVSFQMSFAAVVALVAAYEVLAPKLGRWVAAQSPGGLGLGRRVASYFVGIVATTLIAEIAIGPFAAFHFHQIVTLGLLANLVAVPVMAFWVMPFGLVALLLMPLGWDGGALNAMALGLDVVIATARDVSALPGHVVAVPSMPIAAITAVALGGLWACLWRAVTLKRLGLIPVAAGLFLAIASCPPDILISRDADLVGIRTPYGLHLSARSAGAYEVERWLERAGGGSLSFWTRADGWHADTPPTNCDDNGCIVTWNQTGERRIIALAYHPAALIDDCARADVVISWIPIRQRCPNPEALIGRFDIWRNGAHAVRINRDGTIDVESVARKRGNRPWSRPPGPG